MAWLIPREHGAWAMLLTPFLASSILARRFSSESVAAAVVLVAVFLAREPLVILSRQARVWKDLRPEAARARYWLAAEAVAGVLAAVFLWLRLPAAPLAAMGAAAAALTSWSTRMVVQNRQRSMPLQLVSAAGLNMSALLAWLAARGNLAPSAWWLAALMFTHSAAAVLVVHARLDLRVAARKGADAQASWRRALVAQVAPALGAAICFAAGRPWLAAAPVLSATVHTASLLRMRAPEALGMPLQRVGRRALALSLAYSAIVIAALW
jgi:YwiC-like protein